MPRAPDPLVTCLCHQNVTLSSFSSASKPLGSVDRMASSHPLSGSDPCGCPNLCAMKTRPVGELRSPRRPRLELVTARVLEADRTASAAKDRLRQAKASLKTVKRNFKAAKKQVKWMKR